MPWPQTGENHYYAQLGPQDICRAMQELLGSMAMIYGMGLWTSEGA